MLIAWHSWTLQEHCVIAADSELSFPGRVNVICLDEVADREVFGFGQFEFGERRRIDEADPVMLRVV